MELWDLTIRVERIDGRPVCGLEVGDYVTIRDSSRLEIPPGKHFCIYALASALPLIPAKQRDLPADDWLEHESLVACSDAEERLIMRIERTRRITLDAGDLT